jgi:hypothetical protein
VSPGRTARSVAWILALSCTLSVSLGKSPERKSAPVQGRRGQAGTVSMLQLEMLRRR